MKVDPILLGVISDLLVNLSAGWIGAAVILPSQLFKQKRKRLWGLSVNLVCAILALISAYYLRK